MTPLHIASIYGHADIVQFLVDAECNVRCKDEDLGTPLQFAAAEGNLEVSFKFVIHNKLHSCILAKCTNHFPGRGLNRVEHKFIIVSM